jgi:Zn-dependent peptidase ImmA (M78 family)
VGKGPEIPTLRGEECVRESGITTLPVNPFDIAKSAGIDVYAKSADAGVSGMLIRVGEEFAIAHATHIDNEGFRRFSVGHELGHYFLAGHVDHVLRDGMHASRAGFGSADRYEREADLFAVGLLMPRTLFSKAVDGAGDGLGAIETLADVCTTSLTATAIRYVDFVDAPVAIVVCNQDEIEFCFMSKKFESLDLDWLRAGTSIPRKSITNRFVADPRRILDADRDEGNVQLTTWFTVHGKNADVIEEVIGLGSWGKTLTVLTLPEAVDDEDAEEEAALVRSWTPSLSKSRRK